MARRIGLGNISDPYVIILLIIITAFAFLVSLAVTIAIYAPPIILLVGLIYNEFRSTEPPGLTADEAEELDSAEEARSVIAQNLWEVEEEARRFEVKENTDGTYHRGSKRGVRLNKLKEEIQYSWSLRLEEVTSIDSKINNRIHIGSLRFAFKWAFFVYFVVLAALFLVKPTWFEGFSAFVDQHALARIPNLDFAFYGEALAAGIPAALALGLTYAVRREALRAKTKDERWQLEELLSGEGPGGGDDRPTGEEDGNVEGGDDGSYDDVTDDENGQEHSDGRRRSDRAPPGDDEQQETCYEALGVQPTATRAEIDAAFHVKIKTIHPDRVAGLDPELQALAEEKTKRLNAAREEALRRL